MQKKGKKLLNELAWLAWLGRGALSAAKLLAIEQALHGAIKFHGNLDESEEAALIDFFNKYSEIISIDKMYFSYEPIYQLYYSLLNVHLWSRRYIQDVENLLKKIGI